MNPHIILSKKAVKLYSLIGVALYCLNIESVQSDGTFFPDDIETASDETSKDESEEIKEWAALTPPAKENTQPLPDKKADIIKPVNQPELPAPMPENKGKEQDLSKTDLPILNPSEKQKPLQLTTVAPHPKVLPIHEKAVASVPSKEQKQAQEAIVSYAEIENNRAPLGILEPAQAIQNQKWYIYSSAIRGLKNPSDRVQIVNIEGSSLHRGEEIKDLLIDMGIEADKIQLLTAKGAPNQTGFIYIFGGQ